MPVCVYVCVCACVYVCVCVSHTCTPSMHTCTHTHTHTHTHTCVSLDDVAILSVIFRCTSVLVISRRRNWMSTLRTV